MAHKHTIVSISHSNCVAAEGVNTLRLPTDYDQSSAMGSSRIEMMGMKKTLVAGWKGGMNIE